MVQYTYTPGCCRVSVEWGNLPLQSAPEEGSGLPVRIQTTNGLDSMATLYLENMLYFQTSASAVLNIHDDPLDLPRTQEEGLRGTL